MSFRQFIVSIGFDRKHAILLKIRYLQIIAKYFTGQ